MANTTKPHNINNNNVKLDQGAVIKFDMKSENHIRSVARNGYELSKYFKQIGIKVKNVIPASSEASIRKQFKLSPDSDLICIEISMNNKTPEKKQESIDETREQIVSLSNLRLIDQAQYIYDSSSVVYRFLVKYSLDQSKK